MRKICFVLIVMICLLSLPLSSYTEMERQEQAESTMISSEEEKCGDEGLFSKNEVKEILKGTIPILIGAVISYLSTSMAERRKYRRTNQKENLLNIFIPYCSTIENALAVMGNVENYSKAELRETLSKPLEYLKAEKRVFLKWDQKMKLKEYKEEFDLFWEKWTYASGHFMGDYSHVIGNAILEKDVFLATDIYIKKFFPGIKEEIDTGMLTYQCRSYIKDIKTLRIDTIVDEDNRSGFDYDLSKDDYLLRSAIEEGDITEEELDDNEKMRLELFRALKPVDDAEIVYKIMDTYMVHPRFKKVQEKLKEMNDNLNYFIDHIAY